jgi:hypothetical protein
MRLIYHPDAEVEIAEAATPRSAPGSAVPLAGAAVAVSIEPVNVANAEIAAEFKACLRFSPGKVNAVVEIGRTVAHCSGRSRGLGAGKQISGEKDRR